MESIKLLRHSLCYYAWNVLLQFTNYVRKKREKKLKSAPAHCATCLVMSNRQRLPNIKAASVWLQLVGVEYLSPDKKVLCYTFTFRFVIKRGHHVEITEKKLFFYSVKAWLSLSVGLSLGLELSSWFKKKTWQWESHILHFIYVTL